MTRLARILTTATALTILPLSLACAAGSTSGGSQILNGQVNFNATVSTLNTQTYDIGRATWSASRSPAAMRWTSRR